MDHYLNKKKYFYQVKIVRLILQNKNNKYHLQELKNQKENQNIKNHCKLNYKIIYTKMNHK
jgi:hypothetical protein